MSDLMYEPTEDKSLEKWQKWANEARMESIRADKAEALCDKLLSALKAAPSPLTGDDSEDMCYGYGLWFHGRRQAAIKMVEGEQGETA